jgi:ribonuclease BN (tRNA processing enzyme)
MKSKVEIILTGTGGAEPVYCVRGAKNWARRHPGAVIFIKRNGKKFGIKIDFHAHSDLNMFDAGVPLSDIDIVLVSHAHEDHLNYRYFASKLGDCNPKADPEFTKKPAIVYGPRAVIDTIVEMLARKNFFPFEYKKRGVVGSYQFRSILYARKKIMTLSEVRGGAIINPFPKLEIKILSARHYYQSSYASRGFGKKAFGFLIRDDETERTFFYMTDYAGMSGSVKRYFMDAFSGYKIDLFILGMPVPFSKKGEAHMPLDKTLGLVEELRKKRRTVKNPIIILTHLSDRWLFPETMKRARKIFKKHKLEIWFPPKDGVKIEMDKEEIIKKPSW